MTEKKKRLRVISGMKFYIVRDLAKILDLTEYTIRYYLRQKKLKGVRLGGRWYISEANLKAFLGGGRFFDLPDDIIMDQINEAIKLTFKSNVEWLAYHVKKLIIKDLTEVMTEKFKIIDEHNKRLEKVLPKELMKRFQDRTDKAKKEFEKV